MGLYKFWPKKSSIGIDKFFGHINYSQNYSTKDIRQNGIGPKQLV